MQTSFLPSLAIACVVAGRTAVPDVSAHGLVLGRHQIDDVVLPWAREDSAHRGCGRVGVLGVLSHSQRRGACFCIEYGNGNGSRAHCNPARWGADAARRVQPFEATPCAALERSAPGNDTSADRGCLGRRSSGDSGGAASTANAPPCLLKKAPTTTIVGRTRSVSPRGWFPIWTSAPPSRFGSGRAARSGWRCLVSKRSARDEQGSDRCSWSQ